MRILLIATLLVVALPVGAQSTVAGSTPGSFRVTESGAAEYRIPIRVPPGIAGMEPKLALAYNSQQGNGRLGVGWSLQGLSAIQRCPRTKLQDGARGAIEFSLSDRYCLDGQRLVLVAGTYGGDGAEYRTERESFSKIVSHGSAGQGPAWFSVRTKSGQVMEYGNTADSRIEAEGKPTVRVWALNKASDTKGNALAVGYVENLVDGDYYPDRIDYTSNAAAGQAATHSVRFSYNGRVHSPSGPDVFYGRERGSRITLGNLLERVRTYVGETPVTDYRLAYHAASPARSTQRSRLTSITECSGDGFACLAPVTTAWQESPAAFNAAFSGQTGTDWVSWPTARPLSGDFDGNGRTDIAISADSLGGIGVYLSTGDGNFAPMHSGQTGTDWISWPSAKPVTGDFNGDGYDDIAICAYVLGGIGVYLSNGNGSFTPVFSPQPGTDWCSWSVVRLVTGDFNGDGLTDIAATGDGFEGIATYLSNGNGTFSPVFSGQQGTDWASWPSAKPRVGDFNGDGLTDIAICAYPLGGIALYISHGNGIFAPMHSSQTGTDWCSWPSARPVAGDFNGDGLTDIAVSADGLGGLGVYLSTGDGSFVPMHSDQTGTDWTSWPSARPMAGDFNGDGLTDIAISANGLGGVGLYLSNGNGTFRPDTFSETGTDWISWPGARPVGGDFLGVGRSGIAISASGMGGIGSYHPNAAAPDQVVSISNGSELVWSAGYQPATNPAVYTREAGQPFPVVAMQPALSVVQASSVSNGIGAVTTTTHKYAGAFTNVQAGGFLGFHKIEATASATGIKSSASFRLDYPFQGLPTVSESAQFSGALLSRTTQTWTDAAYPNATGKHHKSELTQSQEQRWDLNGTVLPTVTTTTQHDAYGNPTSITTSTGDGYSKATTNTFLNDAVNWLLGRLTRSTVQSTSP